jgi:flagellar motor switch protein FliN
MKSFDEAISSDSVKDPNNEDIVENSGLELSEGNQSEIVDQLRPKDLSVIHNIPVTLTFIIGKTKISVQDLLKTQKNSIIALDRQVGEKIDVYVNDILFAQGELVLTGKDTLGVSITNIIKNPYHTT